jgi:hypothetical protein
LRERISAETQRAQRKPTAKDMAFLAAGGFFAF